MPAKSRPQRHGRAYPLADGFVGSEFELAATKKPQRRQKPAPRDLKRDVVVAGLDLAGGLLPAPAVPCFDSPATKPRNNAIANTHIEFPDPPKHSEQLDYARVDIEMDRRRH
jgi:hypothetical protein